MHKALVGLIAASSNLLITTNNSMKRIKSAVNVNISATLKKVCFTLTDLSQY